MATRGRGPRLLRWAGAIICADVLLSACVWWGASLAVRHWNGACAPDAALVVFYGGENSHTGSRVVAAARAMDRCPQAGALLVGGARPGRGFYGSEAMRHQLVAWGIAEDRLLTERQSNDSVSNVEAMFSLADADARRALVLVSDPLHILRLTYLAERSPNSADYDFAGLAAWPLDDPAAFLWRPHYEAAAWLMLMLPRGLRDRLIAFVRR